MPSEANPDEILSRMHALRGSLDYGVVRVAQSVSAKSDWRYYVRNHPWASMAAAAVVGYLVVPRRVEQVERLVSDPEALARLAKQKKLVMGPQANFKKSDNSNSWKNQLISLALAAGSRAAMTYLTTMMSEKEENSSSTENTSARGHAASSRPK